MQLQHPYGVQPEHVAALTGASDGVRRKGLGNISRLSDEILLNILGYCDAKDLGRLSSVSKAFYCFCNHEELWKGLVLTHSETNEWEYQGSWRATYIACCSGPHTSTLTSVSALRYAMAVTGFFSDVLHQAWLCSILDVDSSWLETENIDRVSGLSVEEFCELYENANRPVIITDAIADWPALHLWGREYLNQAFGENTVIVGDAPMRFSSYCKYMDAQSDELPLYLFSKNFCEAAPQLSNDFRVPDYFAEDLFSALPSDSRPDYRWLICGPYKSGSTFHQDPNATSAWNAVVKGSKRWIMYPPHVTPPGVRVSEDGADVACPVSLMEWFLSFYDYKDATGVVPLECTLKAGEVLFVPRRWWHMAINLEETIAVTQNYVSAANLKHVLAFLSSPHADVLVSGVRTPEERITLYDRFVEALGKRHPQLLESALQSLHQEQSDNGKGVSVVEYTWKLCMSCYNILLFKRTTYKSMLHVYLLNKAKPQKDHAE